ncbi:MAG: anti-sigma factor, partial [Geminicoccaceae bacterium]
MTDRDLQTLADEYVVGLLDEMERGAVEARLADDQAFVAAVADAQDRFLEIDLTEPPRPVAPESWQRIEASLDATLPELGDRDDTIIPFERPRVQPAASNWPWKAAALAAAAASLILALSFGWQISRPAPLVVAVLLDSDGEPGVLIEAFADNAARIVPLGRIDIPEGKTLEVWTLPDVPDAKPVSLG